MYVIHKHVNTDVFNIIACNHYFVSNKHHDEDVLPSDIKYAILDENPDLLFGDTCRINILSKEITVSTGEYDDDEKIDACMLSADLKRVVTYHSSFD